MNRIELIATDLDDTLLCRDVSVSEYTKDVFRRAKEKRVRIVVATGRMFCAARPWGRAIGVGDVPMIVYTGSMVARCESGEILSCETLDLPIAKEILETARAGGFYVQYYVDDTLYVPYYCEKTEKYEKSCGVAAHVLGDDFWKLDTPPLKILIYEDDLGRMEEAERTFLPAFSERAGWAKSTPFFLEFNAKGASKGAALTKLCAEWGIPLDRVMTFGNAQNDVSMLSITPWSFAVENAAEAAKNAAHFMTDSNQHDGVAKAVAKYVLGES